MHSGHLKERRCTKYNHSSIRSHILGMADANPNQEAKDEKGQWVCIGYTCEKKTENRPMDMLMERCFRCCQFGREHVEWVWKPKRMHEIKSESSLVTGAK